MTPIDLSKNGDLSELLEVNRGASMVRSVLDDIQRSVVQEQKPTPSDPQSYASEVVALLMTADRITARAALSIADVLLGYRLSERAGYVAKAYAEEFGKKP